MSGVIQYLRVILMVTVYLVRHCETMGNVLGIFQGTTDMDVSETGAKQLSFLGERFKSIHIDKIYSSPLLRARKTANVIAEPKGLEVIVDNGLIEISGGIIEGVELTYIFEHYPELEDTWCNDFQNFAPEGGEAIRDTYNRGWAALSKIIAENDGKTIAVASHGGLIRTLLCRLIKNDIELIGEIPFSDNTAVAKIIFKDTKNWHVEYINDISHLPKDMPRNPIVVNNEVKK